MARSVERDIVVLATREASAERDRALALAVGAGPQWAQVADVAFDHGVVPLLVNVIRCAPWRSAVPREAMERMELMATAIALKNGALLEALGRVVSALARAGIEPIVLKGPALARTVYADQALRPFTDLDLLCPRHQLPTADAVLRACGYERVQQKPTEQDDFHAIYRSSRGAKVIELHADLLQLGLPTRSLASLWRHLEFFTVTGTLAALLAPEQQILHLCVHLHTHGYGRLIWFKDLDLLLRQRGHEVNWSLVHTLAAEEGATLSVRNALSLLRELLDTPLPPDALTGPASDPLGALAHAILWPRRRIVELRGKQRLRSLRFNPRLGPLGMVPSLVVMGRRREKLARLLVGDRVPALMAPRGVSMLAAQPTRNFPVTKRAPEESTLEAITR